MKSGGGLMREGGGNRVRVSWFGAGELQRASLMYKGGQGVVRRTTTGGDSHEWTAGDRQGWRGEHAKAREEENASWTTIGLFGRTM
jgi:hypothetical protein